MTAVTLREWHGVKPVALPSGTATTTRLRTTPADETLLDAVSAQLGRLRRGDLAAVSRLEPPVPGQDSVARRQARQDGLNSRKRNLTALSSARWANAIIAANDARRRSSQGAQDRHIAALRAV